MSVAPFETAYTEKNEVHCDGGRGPHGHPRVFLHIDAETGTATCPYCSKVFIHKADAARYASLE